MNKISNKLEARTNCKSQLTTDPQVKFKINAGGFYRENTVLLTCLRIVHIQARALWPYRRSVCTSTQHCLAIDPIRVYEDIIFLNSQPIKGTKSHRSHHNDPPLHLRFVWQSSRVLCNLQEKKPSRHS